jgi:His Kinase A (phospho-acceptor) domain
MKSSAYKNMDSASDRQSARSPEGAPQFDPEKHVSPGIAHELNNILAIVQGYTDRLLMKYTDNSALQSELKLVCEAARRAAAIIREATPRP